MAITTLFAALALAQASSGSLPVEISPGGGQTGTYFVGSKGVTETVAEIQARWDAMSPEEKLEQQRRKGSEHEVDRRGLRQNPRSPELSQWPPRSGALAKDYGGPYLPQVIGTTFNGPVLSESGSLPPDSQGAAGPTQYLVFVNGRIRVYSKTGVPGSLDVAADTFWASVITPGSGTSDPRVRFDRLTNKWYLCMIDVAEPNRILIAVSSGPTITNTSSFTFFQFQSNTENMLADYPTLGVDKDALYIGTNDFLGNTFNQNTVYVVKKSTVVSGGTLTGTRFNIGENGVNTLFTPQGVDNDDPASTTGYFIGVSSTTFGQLRLLRVLTPGGTPTLAAQIALTTPSTSFPLNVGVLGSTQPLDALDDRLYAATIRLNRNTGVRSLWTAHNIGVNSTGTTASPTRTGSRFYEIRNFTTTPVLTQSGTLFSTVATNPDNFWIPTVNMSGQGHMAMGMSMAGGARRAGIGAAGRLVGDALGTIRAATLAQASASNYNAQTGGTQRWGDYSQVSVDPVDDMTMWTTQMYCNATNSWAIRVIQLKAPAPAVVASISPTSIAQGATANIVITGTATNGTGFFDPGTGFTGRLRAAFSGTGLTVNSVTYTNPTSMTVNVTAAGGAITGVRSLTVTNPDNQTSTLATALTVTAGGAGLASVTMNPTAVTNGTPSTGTVTFSANVTANSTVTLTSSDTTAATVPASVVVTTGTSTKTFTASTKPVAVQKVVTITATHNAVSRTATLTVNPGAALESLYVLPTSVKGGTASTGLVALTTVPTANFGIVLSSSNTTVATVPVSVTVLTGTTTRTFTVTTSVRVSTATVTITASKNGVVKAQALTVTP